MRAIAILLALLIALPAVAQEGCPWAGSVSRVKRLEHGVILETIDDPDVLGRVEGHPNCEITVEEVRAAAKRPACNLYADRPDALGLEMVLHCLLEETDGLPPDGTHVYLSGKAAERLMRRE
ncbi:MAG: hypothetical protein D6754_12540 [Alphaproteobacteria bacterium]|nr:MAG: hypothetical protein D6754_12540 [Alphaproteobacteria bacterium]